MDFSKFPRVNVHWRGEERDVPSCGDLLLQEMSGQGVNIVREDFLNILFEANRKTRKKWDEGILYEVSSEDKFLGILEEIKIRLQGSFSKALMIQLARKFTQVHMERIIQATTISHERKESLSHLARGHHLGLVSNFDHAPSGHEILKTHNIAQYFKKIVISDELGKRKPHPQLFVEAMNGLGVSPEETLMVGDTPLADIQGAAQLGLDTVWIQRKGQIWPENLNRPTHTLADLTELRGIPRVK